MANVEYAAGCRAKHKSDRVEETSSAIVQGGVVY